MYMMDINFIFEQSKFLSGMLQYLSYKIGPFRFRSLCSCPPWLSWQSATSLSKSKKLKNTSTFFSIDNYEEPNQESNSLYEQIRKIYDNNDIVSLKPLNLKDEDSIRDVL